MTEPALISLSRATRSITAGCIEAAAPVSLRGADVEVLLTTNLTGSIRHGDLALRLHRSTIQPVTGPLRRQGLLALTGYGHASKLELTAEGLATCRTISTYLDHRWDDLVGIRRRAEVAVAVQAIRSLVSEPNPGQLPAVSTSAPGWPDGLLATLTQATHQLAAATLAHLNHPEMREAALRPMLLLQPGPRDAGDLAHELGISRAAVNIALATPLHHHLIRRAGPRPAMLALTPAGAQVASQMAEASESLWLTVAHQLGPHAAVNAASLVADIGSNAPASARPAPHSHRLT